MLLGAFEPVAKPWGMDGIPRGFLLRPAAARISTISSRSSKWRVNRMPMLADGRHPHLLQRAGELHARRPLLSRRGAGAARLLGRGGLQLDRHRLVRRRRHGAGAMDGTTASRPSISGRSTSAATQPFQSNRTLPQASGSRETLGLLYADHFPYRQMATARGVRRSPLHEHLKARGAVFGEVAGWERANWFADAGAGARIPLFLEAAELVRQPARRAPGGAQRRRPVRHDLVRQDPGRGPRRRRPSCNGSAATTSTCRRAGSSTPRCSTTRGGIEADLTVTRLSETAFLLVVPGRDAAARPRLAAPAPRRRFRRHHRRDRRRRRCCAVMGPKARELLQTVSPERLVERRPSVRHGAARSRSASASPAPIASPMSANSAGSFTSRPTGRACVRGARGGRRGLRA